ncbi:MAG: hypothetical protein FWE61_10585 [Micrococcales bacterium]|nr:hypothetical protein [Micrococcales bacterium]
MGRATIAALVSVGLLLVTGCSGASPRTPGSPTGASTTPLVVTDIRWLDYTMTVASAASASNNRVKVVVEYVSDTAGIGAFDYTALYEQYLDEASPAFVGIAVLDQAGTKYDLIGFGAPNASAGQVDHVFYVFTIPAGVSLDTLSLKVRGYVVPLAEHVAG